METQAKRDAVAHKLRLLANQVENNTLGALSLNCLGEVFGNDFWNLVQPVDNRDLLERIAKASEQMADNARGFSCLARRSNADPPQDCNWPLCGCDPRAQKVVDVLHESGRLK